MKIMFVLLCTCSFLLASPSYQESTSESLIGANDTSYAVRRTESNNQGSYYASQETIYIDEYNKGDGKLIKSTLLIDRVLSIDVEHSDPNSSPSTIVKTVKKNDKIILADLYEKYSPLDHSYQPDWFENFKYTDNGICLGERLVISQHSIDKLYKISLNHYKADPKLLSIEASGNSIFFKVTTRRSEDGVSNKIICTTPEQTKRVYAWAYIEPIYLQISTHETLDEANQRGLEIYNTAREKKRACRLEIWSKRSNTSKMTYSLVYANSSYLIRDNKVEQHNEMYNTEVIPVSSSSFSDRWLPHTSLSAKLNEDGNENK